MVHAFNHITSFKYNLFGTVRFFDMEYDDSPVACGRQLQLSRDLRNKM